MSEPAGTVASAIAGVMARISAAATRAGRAPGAVTLVTVSKTYPAEAVRAAFTAGARTFGENYVQELLAKQDELADLQPAPEWHMIGRLQRNKAKDVAGRVALVHSVDSIELARALDRRATARGAVQRILVEVNLGGETTKGGVAPAGLPALLDDLRGLPALRCVGLMTMPPPVEDAEENRPHFHALADLAKLHGLAELSMGMSGDFEVAIEEGATLVRVGTAIFGARATR